MNDMYDDGPITIDDQQIIYKTINKISPWRLAEMLRKYPALTKSWEAFIIDYNICLSNEMEEEDDIPF